MIVDGINGHSLNIKQDRLEKLKEVMPELFSEGKIDFEKIKNFLGNDLNINNERYVLNWAGKANAIQNIQTSTTATLEPCEDESINFDSTENIFIEGENLEVLKVLQKSYYGKIKMIYIDPPYNTGNDSFIYPDKFSETKEEYLSRINEKTEDGVLLKEGLFRKNGKENGQYHSNWLSMMYPRLFLAKNLLKEDGVIFVSIDDNEVHNLKLLMNEIFGEENFITTIHVELSATQGMKIRAAKDGNLVKNAEYILVYSRNGKKNIASTLLYDYRPEYDDHYSKFLNTDLSITNLKEVFARKYPNIKIENLTIMYNKSSEFREFIKNNTDRIVADDKITGFDIDEYPEPNKVYEVERNSNHYYIYNNGTKLRQLLVLADSFGQCDDFLNSYGLRKIRGDWWKDFYKDMGNVSKEGDVAFPNGKKPVRLISQIIKMCTTNNEIILDFFAGSGTTAHAVLDLNKKNGCSRKFICIQLPERIDENSEDYKEEFKTIAELSKERIRRVIKKLKEENRQLKLEQPDYKEDLGFKVFKLKDSNFKKWQNDYAKTEEELANQLNVFENPIKEKTKEENILWELLIKAGYDLNTKIEEKTFENIKYYSIVDNQLIVLLESISHALIEKIILAKPQKCVCLDRLFENNDQIKANIVLQMQDAEIIFKTV